MHLRVAVGVGIISQNQVIGKFSNLVRLFQLKMPVSVVYVIP